jgi:UV DNA damage endonuclease
MNIGYACLTVGVPDTQVKNCRLKSVTDTKLVDLIQHNLQSLENMIDYNGQNDIRLFRISSDIIPFGSSPVNTLPWTELFSGTLQTIGRKIKRYNIRVSMHPGQYSVLNSPIAGVVQRTIDDLRYHARFLDALGADVSSKIILHIGGVYGDKISAMARFVQHYRYLDLSIKRRLVIENDDRSFNLADALDVGNNLAIPVVFDNLHHEVNRCDLPGNETDWVRMCARTWNREDGVQKIHYSQQDPDKKPGSHAEWIAIDAFLSFAEKLVDPVPDIMLEVKDKNRSAVKCINCTTKSRTIAELEQEWGRYKYAVLERSPGDYHAIRNLLKDKDTFPAIPFYHYIEHALKQEMVVGNQENAAMHVWGYFKNQATASEHRSFIQSLDALKTRPAAHKKVKTLLWKLAEKYEQAYLLNSYYFQP